jgi:carboxylesterase type B
MDIYTPTDAVTSGKKLPVYFFIQGGGFAELSNPNYNGTYLVEASGHNIIVVTFNYRVGPFGFLAGQEVEQDASLNNGLKDQRKALEWVQKYISKVSTAVFVFDFLSNGDLSLAEIPNTSSSVVIVPEARR